MDDGDLRDAAYLDQGQIASLYQIVMQLMDQFFPPPPIEPNQLYTRQEAMRRTRIGDRTWSTWVKNGLVVYRPGTASQYVWGADLIQFIRGQHGPVEERTR